MSWQNAVSSAITINLVHSSWRFRMVHTENFDLQLYFRKSTCINILITAYCYEDSGCLQVCRTIVLQTAPQNHFRHCRKRNKPDSHNDRGLIWRCPKSKIDQHQYLVHILLSCILSLTNTQLALSLVCIYYHVIFLYSIINFRELLLKNSWMIFYCIFQEGACLGLFKYL